MLHRPAALLRSHAPTGWPRPSRDHATPACSGAAFVRAAGHGDPRGGPRGSLQGGGGAEAARRLAARPAAFGWSVEQFISSGGYPGAALYVSEPRRGESTCEGSRTDDHAGGAGAGGSGHQVSTGGLRRADHK